VISATGQAEVTRSVDDSQDSWESAKGVFCLQVVSSDRSNLDGSKMDGGRPDWAPFACTAGWRGDSTKPEHGK